MDIPREATENSIRDCEFNLLTILMLRLVYEFNLIIFTFVRIEFIIMSETYF